MLRRHRNTLIILGLAFVIVLPFLLWNRPGTKKASIPKSALRIVWRFEPRQRGGISAGLALDSEFIYLATIRDNGLGVTGGAVYCVDRKTGKLRWEFDDDGGMLHTISTPLLYRNRVYVGEGMHGDVVSKAYCLDARSGKKYWSRSFGGHVESGPVASQDTVLVTAGDDGIHAIDAVSGKSMWRYAGSGHVDAAPKVEKDVVCGGSAISRQHHTQEIFCLDFKTGTPIWRVASPLPIWASPVVGGDHLFVPIGNGRLTSSEPPPGRPAGGLLCVSVRNGETRWQVPVQDGVFASPVVDKTSVYFVSRDCRVRAVDRERGEIKWKQEMDSPIVATPALLDNHLYVVATEGEMACFQVSNGEKKWNYDLAELSPARPRLLSSPAVVEGSDGSKLIYLGTELRSEAGSTATLFCFEEVSKME